jgi:hypothetical protein
MHYALIQTPLQYSGAADIVLCGVSTAVAVQDDHFWLPNGSSIHWKRHGLEEKTYLRASIGRQPRTYQGSANYLQRGVEAEHMSHERCLC